MAICPDCKLEMLDPATVDCPANHTVEFPDGTVLPSVPYTHEYPHALCHDCYVAVGHYHHPGCDMERCPCCHGQLIGCDCHL